MAELEPEGENIKAEGKGKLWLLVIPLALLSMGAGGFMTFSQYPVVSRLVASSPKDAAEEAEKPVEYGFFHQFDGLTVNPAGSGGSRYLMMNVGMEAPEEAILEELKSREIVVRDTIIKLLSMRTVDDLATVETRTVLKEEVRSAVNGILREGQVDRVYFTQYVLQ